MPIELDNWLSLKAYTNYPQPAPGPIDFAFKPVTTGCVRVLGTELGQDDHGLRYFQLQQLQAFGE